ncbi:MAG: L,D-transpeptidase [Christensenellaceae bacterium]|jgi:lipoprotein-anchoring transpeptidase ErfK/SrfK
MKKVLILVLVVAAILFLSGASFDIQEGESFFDWFGRIWRSFVWSAQEPSLQEENLPAAVATPTPTPKPTPTPTPIPTPTPTPEPTPEPLPEPYTMAWLDRYAPAAVAPFEEQVGDNGDYEEILQRPDPSQYKLVVDYHNQCVFAYSQDEKGEYTVLERAMICTTGGNGEWTPEGTYSMGDDYHRFGFFVNFNCYAQYWTQMSGSFYFHSILYSARDASTYTMSSYNNLGKPGSHGCIRLLVPDARWIYENCAPETICVVTTEFEKDEALKNALRNGYEGATDYVAPDENEDEEEEEEAQEG